MCETNNALLLEAADPEMRKLLEQLVKAMNDIEDNSVHIDMLLDSAITYYEADRAYVIEGDTDLVVGVNTHERCAPGIESQNDTLKDMAPDVYSHWLRIFQNNRDVVIPDMEEIKEVRPNEYKYFNDSDVRSLIVVPFHKRISMGFLGVDNPKRHITDPLPLRVLSYAIVLELNELKLTREKDALLQVSERPENTVYVHLLGTFEISARGGSLFQDNFTQQGQVLITLLLLHPQRSFSSNDIYEIISQDKESDNPTNVVNSAIYRVRNTLAVVGLKDFLLCNRGRYSLNPRITIECDAGRFENFYAAMKRAKNPSEKLDNCHHALDQYNAPLQEHLSDSIRWSMECSDLNTRFLNIVTEGVNLHIERGEFTQAYEMAHKAIDIDRNDPRTMLVMAKAMKAMKSPSLKSFVKSIIPALDDEEQEHLKKILGR